MVFLIMTGTYSQSAVNWMIRKFLWYQPLKKIIFHFLNPSLIHFSLQSALSQIHEWEKFSNYEISIYWQYITDLCYMQKLLSVQLSVFDGKTERYTLTCSKNFYSSTDHSTITQKPTMNLLASLGQSSNAILQNSTLKHIV